MTNSAQSSEKAVTRSGGVATTRLPARDTYSAEDFFAVFEVVATGKSLIAACKADGAPTPKTVYERVKIDPEIRDAFNTALAMRAELLAEEVLIDACALPDGSLDSPTFNSRQRLMVDSKKWACAILVPKKYGPKMALGGADDLPPIKSIAANVPAPDAYKLMLAGGVQTDPDGSELV